MSRAYLPAPLAVRERYALKALRGDFANLEASGIEAARSVASDVASSTLTHGEGRA
jgi:hypothetical protein